MNNSYKSPYKASKLSLPTNSCSKTPHRNKIKPLHSQSKYTPSIKMSQAINQAYTNVLNRLLRINQLPEFVKQATRYVILTEEIIDNLRINQKESRKSRKQIPEIGKTLLIDGGFIKHYCKLMEHYFPGISSQIRQSCYQKYKDEVIFRKKMFDFYFKQEITEENNKIISLMNSRAKAKQYSINQTPLRSVKKSQKKGTCVCSLQSIKQSKADDNVSELSSKEASTVSFTSNHQLGGSKSLIFSSTNKKIQIQKQKQIVQVESDTQYASPVNKRIYKRKQTEEEREKRLQGIVRETQFMSKSKSRRKIITIQEELKSNKKLAEIYEQVMKEKAERENNQNEQRKKNISTQIPIVRSSIDEKWQMIDAARLKKISPDPFEKLSEIQKDMIKRFPKAIKRGRKAAVTMGPSIVLGRYKNYTIRKAVITDIYHYLEPIYTALLLETIDQNNRPNISQYQFEEDQTIEVILVD